MKFTIPAHILRAAMACQAKQDIRYYLNGVLFTATGDVVATNGHVMFVGKADFELPEDMIIAFDKMPTKAVESVDIDIEAKLATYRKKRGEDFSGLSVVDGKFPDYKRVIPDREKREEIDGIGIQAQYLSLPDKAFGPGPVAWQFFGKHQTMIVEPRDTGPVEWNGAFIVVMPCRVD